MNHTFTDDTTSRKYWLQSDDSGSCNSSSSSDEAVRVPVVLLDIERGTIWKWYKRTSGRRVGGRRQDARLCLEERRRKKVGRKKMNKD